jgi:hypothetical protein
MMEEMKTQPATTTVNGKCTHTFTDDEIAAIIQVMDARYPDNSKKRYREHFDDESKILEHLACVDLPFAWPEAKLPLKKAEVVAGLWTMNRSIEAIRNGK